VSLLYYSGINIWDADMYSVQLNSAAGLPGAESRLDWLMNENWVDLQTQFVGVRLFLLNPDLAVYNHAHIKFFFGPGGEIANMVDTNVFRAEPYQDSSLIGIDIVFAVFIFTNIFEYYLYVQRALMENPPTIHKFVRDGWTWVHFATGHGGLILIGLWMMSLLNLKGLQDDILILQECGNRTARFANGTFLPSGTIAADVGGMEPDDPHWTDCLKDIHESAQTYIDFLKMYRTILGYFAMFLIVRFMRVFSMQPKLAMVTNTLYLAWDQVFHHMIIFICLVLGYALSGMIVFGKVEPSFGRLDLAIAYCFTAMLGEFDFVEMTRTDHSFAGFIYVSYFWFYSFTILIGFLMLNCLMAIIMDVYVEVKSGAVLVPPIWTHYWLMLTEAWYARSWVSIRVVIHAVSMHIPQNNSKIDKETLTKLIPGMTEHQSEFLITGAVEQEKADADNGVSLGDALHLIGDISVTAKRSLYHLDVLVAEMQSECNDARAAKAEADAAEEAMMGEAGSSSRPRTLFCRGFNARADAIDDRLASLERMMEDSACWHAFRTQQMHQQFVRIEAKLREGESRLRERGAIRGLPQSASQEAEPSEPAPPALLGNAAVAARRRENWPV